MLRFQQNCRSCDLFGKNVQFTYNGQDQYSTKCGCAMTIIVILAFLSFFAVKMIEFLGMEDPLEFMSETGQSMNKLIQLSNLFAIQDVDNLDEGVRVELTQVNWNGKDVVKRETPIAMGPCDMLADIPLENIYKEARNGKKKVNYICPLDGQAMEVRGGYDALDFDYIRLSVIACDAGTTC